MEEEKIYKDIELRSEEVQEVMNHISPWVVRCGITVLAVILLMVLVGCWIFRYPDTLAAEVTLATEEPPRLCAVTCYWETRYALCEEREFGGGRYGFGCDW